MYYLFSHSSLGPVVSVFLRQDHRESACSASGNYRYLMHWICVRKRMRNDCMARFMKCGELAFVFTYHSALLLRSCYDLCYSGLDFIHTDLASISPGRKERRFIQHVLYVSRGESRRTSSKHLRIDIVIKRLVA